MYLARKLIVHYHLFKNAGTSVDANLRRIFGDGFQEVEFGGPAEIFNAERLVQYLEENPQVGAVSSHTLSLPLPVRDDWLILPIMFLRHPLDRIQSMYRYEKLQVSDSPGAVLAKEYNFPDYVTARLSSPEDIMLRNWQVRWMSRDELDFNTQSYADEIQFESALRVLEKLPFVGVVEHFSKSLAVLNHVLSKRQISADFKVEAKNRSPVIGESLPERLKVVRLLLGDRLYEELEQANAMDIRLHEHASSVIETRFTGLSK